MTLSNNTEYKVIRNGKESGTAKGAIELFALIDYVKSIGYESLESFRKDYPNDEFEMKAIN